MKDLDSKQDSAFSVWLRTGRFPPARVAAVEYKFNPWHDPTNGRFTYVGAGRNYGQNYSGTPSAGRGRGLGSSLAAVRDEPRRQRGAGGGGQQFRTQSTSSASPSALGLRAPGLKPGPRRRPGELGWVAGGWTGGGRGSFGGGGATSREPWPDDPPARHAVSRTPSGSVATPAALRASQAGRQSANVVAPSPLRREVRNGYEYQIDGQGRTRRVSGALALAGGQARSRRMQRRAGGRDRRLTDDGGHHIAPRFNGPTEAFNHFAQDANFNRGEYRLLEDQWARAKRAGRNVTVKIAPGYEGASQRPAVINIWFTIDGDRQSLQNS